MLCQGIIVKVSIKLTYLFTLYYASHTPRHVKMVKHSGFCNADELTNVHKLFIKKHCVLKMERKYLTFIFHFFDFKRCGCIGLLLLKLQIGKPSGFCDAEELTNVHK